MTPSERSWFEKGQESILNDLWYEIAILEELIGKSGSYAKGQKYILRELVKAMALKEP